MTKNAGRKPPGQSDTGSKKKEAREARAARALRENLLKRKKQLQARKPPSTEA